MANESTELKLGLSPEEILAALKTIGDQASKTAAVMEEQLGKKGGQAVNDLKDNVEKGTNQISTFFGNLRSRIASDLKAAFDVSSVFGGLSIAKQINEGVKSVFDMERAFDRLGVRLGLTSGQMENFKRAVGQATSKSGVNVQDVQAGLMAAASAGVKDPRQLTQVAESLAKARQIDPTIGTGEGVTESIAEILRRQHIGINGQTYGQTMDAINGATATGNFRNSSDAAAHIATLSNFSATNGMDTRQLAGLATLSSKGGPAIQGLLDQILEVGSQVGGSGAAKINSTLNQQVFKNGKLDPVALAKVNPNQWGSASILGEASGLNGANGGDLKVLIETFRDNMGAFNSVVHGTGETAEQFDKVSQSWAAKTEMFKTRLSEAGREIGDSLVEFASGVASGDAKKYSSGLGHLGDTISNNKGDLAVGAGLTLGSALLMGGGVRGLVGMSAAKAAGIQQVYVTNAGEISGGIGGTLGKVGQAGAVIGTGLALGYGAASLADKITGGGYSNIVGKPGEWLAGALQDDDKTGDRTQMTPQQYSDMVSVGFLKAMQQHESTKRPPAYTNPSSVKGQGAKVGS